MDVNLRLRDRMRGADLAEVNKEVAPVVVEVREGVEDVVPRAVQDAEVLGLEVAHEHGDLG